MADTRSSLTQECQDIATHLSAQTGHTWTLTVQDPEHWHRLHGPDGACVNLHRVWNHAERLRIKGVFPQGPNREDCLPYHTQLPAITVARARGAEAISRDIVHRFLPPYTELLQQAQARKAQFEADDAAQHALMDRLVAHACVEAPSGGGEGLRVKRTSAASTEASLHVWGRVQITGADAVRLELHGVPEALAHQIFRTLDQLTLPY
jgi:hypothetical protein